MQTTSFPATYVDLQLGAPKLAPEGTMFVQMRTRRVYPDGTPLNSGFTYTVDKTWGAVAVDNNWAIDVDKVLPETARLSITELSEEDTSVPQGYVEQFDFNQNTLATRAYPVTATGQIYLGPCAVVGIKAVTVGAGTLTIHDATDATDATLLRMSRASGNIVAGTDYPLVSPDDKAGMLFSTGAYVTIPAGGVYWLYLIDGAEIPGAVNSGMLCALSRVTASGVVNDPATGQALGDVVVVSVKVIAPGSANNLDIRGGVAVTDSLLHPSTAFGALAADQIIKFGPVGGGLRLTGLYITIPTSGIVLVNYLPR